MALKKITIPAAGKSQAFQMSGLSAMIVQAPSYTDITKAAKLSFDNPGDGWPVVAGATIPNDECKFNNITITGTPESAGDEVVIMAVNLCLDASISHPPAPDKAICGTSFKKTMDDTVQTISDLEIINAAGELASAIYIACSNDSTAGIDYLFNDDPSQDNLNYHLTPGAVPIKIVGVDFIRKIRFINATATETPTLIITSEF